MTENEHADAIEKHMLRDGHTYLGDGVYAEFDGYDIWLRTGDHRNELCTNRICLETIVLDRLLQFVDEHIGIKKND